MSIDKTIDTDHFAIAMDEILKGFANEETAVTQYTFSSVFPIASFAV